MFNRKKEETRLDQAIDEVFNDMETLTADSDKYTNAVDNLVKLHELTRANKRVWTPSADTIAIAVTNITGILLILNYEHLHPLPSKAMNFVLKMH